MGSAVRINWLLLFAALTPTVTQSQTVSPADTAVAQPLVYRNGGVIIGCGLRVVAVLELAESEALIYDFAVVSRLDTPKDAIPVAFAKAGAQIADMKMKPSPEGYLGKSFFIASEDGTVTAAPVKFVDSDTKGFVMGAFDPVAGLELLRMMGNGESLQIGITTDEQKITRVLRFAVTLEQADKRSFSACMTFHLDAITNWVDKEKTEQ